MNTEQKQSNNEKNIESVSLLYNEKINILKRELLKNQKNIDDIELRKLAKIENIKKNTQEQIKRIKKTEIEIFLKKTIPIIDSLENILSLSHTLNIKDQPLITGIELTLHSLLHILFKLGVKCEGKKNEMFNSVLHNVIAMESSEKIPENQILSVQKKGFTFDKILLRKASVIISKK